jgi:hypothetical protein
MNVAANSTAEIVRQLLINLNQGTDPALGAQPWPVFDSNEPDSPDNAITVYDTQGQDDGRSSLDGEVWSHPGFQIRVRSLGFSVGWKKASAIRVALATQAINVTVTIGTASYWIPNIAKIGQVLRIGKEKPQALRDIFTLNALVALEVE